MSLPPMYNQPQETEFEILTPMEILKATWFNWLYPSIPLALLGGKSLKQISEAHFWPTDAPTIRTVQANGDDLD